MIETQSSQLLPGLFEYVDEHRPLSVLHLGAAMPETLDFFSMYRCRLYVADLFDELPLQSDADGGLSVRQQLEAALELPSDARFDLCLFWDLFNFLDAEAISCLQDLLRPHFHLATLGHGFASHNSRVRPPDRNYGIKSTHDFSLRQVAVPRSGYVARGQGPLKAALDRFAFGRTVLLADKRLEFILSVRR